MYRFLQLVLCIYFHVFIFMYLFMYLYFFSFLGCGCCHKGIPLQDKSSILIIVTTVQWIICSWSYEPCHTNVIICSTADPVQVYGCCGDRPWTDPGLTLDWPWADIPTTITAAGFSSGPVVLERLVMRLNSASGCCDAARLLHFHSWTAWLQYWKTPAGGSFYSVSTRSDLLLRTDWRKKLLDSEPMSNTKYVF